MDLQKQPSGGVLKKMCFENIQQIYGGEDPYRSATSIKLFCNFGVVQLYNRLCAKSGRIARLVWRKENMFHTFLSLTLRRLMRAAIDVTLCDVTLT